MAPIDWRIRIVKGGAPALQGANQFGMDFEAIWKLQERRVQGFQAVPAGRGRFRRRRGRLWLERDSAVLRRACTHALANALELVQARLQERLGVALAHDATPNEIRGEQLTDGGLLLD